MEVAEEDVDVAGDAGGVLVGERVILAEGRQTYIVASLDTDDPFKRVVGWGATWTTSIPSSRIAPIICRSNTSSPA